MRTWCMTRRKLVQMPLLCLLGFSSRRMIPVVRSFSYSNSPSSFSRVASQRKRRTVARRIRITSLHSTSSLESDATGSKCLDTLFDLDLPEGRCVGLELRSDIPDDEQLTTDAIESNQNHWIRSHLHEKEIAYGLEQASDAARHTFFIGRLAMRRALEPGIQNSNFAILKDGYGRPTVPDGFLGSISHKKLAGAAMVAPDESTSRTSPRLGIGIDLERSAAGSINVARKVLTADEQLELGKLAGVKAEEEVLLRFSIKESLYKAIHPLICQYVGFKEAEVEPLPDGTVRVELNLTSGDHLRFETVEAHWRRVGDYFLSSASVRLKDGVEPASCDADTVHLGRNS